MSGVSRHGTPAGHAAHQRQDERPCAPCLRAKSEYDKQYRGLADNALKGRIRAKARGLAERDLRTRHRDEYTNLYQQYKEDLLIEAGLIDE